MNLRITYYLLLLLVGGIGYSLAQDVQEPNPISTKLAFTISQSGYEKADTLIITKQIKWDEICKKAGIDLSPEVDFSKEIVLVIAAGKCPSTGYEIKAQEISEENKKLVVKYTIAPPIEGEPTTKTITTPLVGITIKQTNLPIEFVRSEKEIKDLIKKLGDDEWKIREAATTKLIKMGKIMVPAVLKALQDKDPEVVIRAQIIIKEVVQTLLIERTGWIGIRMMEVPTSDDRIARFINEGVGIEITEVIEGTPAEKFKLIPEDIIIGFNNEGLADLEDFRKRVHDILPETKVDFTIIRKGEKIDLPLVLGIRPEEYREKSQETLWEEWAKKYFPKNRK